MGATQPPRQFELTRPDARIFLSTPHPLLEGRAPLKVALTELGVGRVEELLWKLFYGLPA